MVQNFCELQTSKAFVKYNENCSQRKLTSLIICGLSHYKVITGGAILWQIDATTQENQSSGCDFV